MFQKVVYVENVQIVDMIKDEVINEWVEERFMSIMVFMDVCRKCICLLKIFDSDNCIVVFLCGEVKGIYVEVFIFKKQREKIVFRVFSCELL